MNIIREAVRIVLMLLGALLFVVALVPVLNPAEFVSATKNASVSALHWTASILALSVLVLLWAWRLNPKSKRKK